jgi:hypothetical protein
MNKCEPHETLQTRFTSPVTDETQNVNAENIGNCVVPRTVPQLYQFLFLFSVFYLIINIIFVNIAVNSITLFEGSDSMRSLCVSLRR